MAADRMELRLVLMRKGLFHPKVWLFSDHESTVVAHGSGNATEPGLLYNWETVSVERSWMETERTNTFSQLFKDLWEGSDPTSLTIRMPEGLRFIKHMTSDHCPTINDFWDAWRDDIKNGYAPPLPPDIEVPEVKPVSSKLTIPEGIQWQHGSFSHQGDAVVAWEKNDGQGIMAIATGGGKTIASLIAATRLQDRVAPLLVVIAAPYKPLLKQWTDELTLFGITAVPIEGLSPGKREARLQLAIMSLEMRQSEVEAIVVSHGLLNQDDFRRFLASIPDGVSTLLIADEVHKLGAPGFSKNPPEEFRYRIGLSATPVRQYDDEGTDALKVYFGDIVFEFDLGEAIRADCLTRYNYHLHPVKLTPEEIEEWDELSERLRRVGYVQDGDTSREHLSDATKLLLIKRRGILENASGKIEVLQRLLEQTERFTIRHTLIYTSAKPRANQVRQITQVNRMLNDLGIVAHELTYNQTGSGVAQDILEDFERGTYQALTCMKVLDEGINIPQTTTAYLLASSTVHREWVQRRGRILRKSPNKDIAHLHDFLVVPPEPNSPTGRAILRRELERGREFASLAENSGVEDGPWQVMAEFEPKIH